MRVTTDFWVSALVRRVFSQGGYAAVVRRGATEAGAVFVSERSRMGTLTLYGPAPQTSYEEGRPQDRQFVVVAEAEDEEKLAERIARETRFDPDVWVIEVEPGSQPITELLEIAKT